MRSIFLLGGFVGFLLVAATGWLADRSTDLVLRDAALGALVGGFLFRWFWSLWAKAIIFALTQKRATEAAAAVAAEAAAKNSASPTPVSRSR